MKTHIKCSRGRRSRWRDMPGGKRQATDFGILEYRHCVCGSTHTQYLDASVSSRLKTRKNSRLKSTHRTVTAKAIMKGRMLRMLIPLGFR